MGRDGFSARLQTSKMRLPYRFKLDIGIVYAMNELLISSLCKLSAQENTTKASR
jgi:hypothetical protein